MARGNAEFPESFIQGNGGVPWKAIGRERNENKCKEEETLCHYVRSYSPVEERLQTETLLQQAGRRLQIYSY